MSSPSDQPADERDYSLLVTRGPERVARDEAEHAGKMIEARMVLDGEYIGKCLLSSIRTQSDGQKRVEMRQIRIFRSRMSEMHAISGNSSVIMRLFYRKDHFYSGFIESTDFSSLDDNPEAVDDFICESVIFFIAHFGTLSRESTIVLKTSPILDDSIEEGALIRHLGGIWVIHTVFSGSRQIPEARVGVCGVDVRLGGIPSFLWLPLSQAKEARLQYLASL